MSGQRAIDAAEEWNMLGASVDHFRRKVLPDALFSLAQVFLTNGDRNAFLYTGSPAMHSEKLLVFEVSGRARHIRCVHGTALL